VLPRSKIKITEISSSYLFTKSQLGTSNSSHPVHEYRKENQTNSSRMTQTQTEKTCKERRGQVKIQIQQTVTYVY
jgi:hypothetical protein